MWFFLFSVKFLNLNLKLHVLFVSPPIIPDNPPFRMLYLVGLGLGDGKDITVKGLEVVRSCDQVFLEAYTSLLISSETSELESYYNKKIQIADREVVESGCECILGPAKDQNIAFLVVGDPLGATTHTDLILRAVERGISYKVIHNASIMNAIASTGLQLYNFGETVSICFWKENWRPTSFVDKIIANLKRGLHVLCLLDIRVGWDGGRPRAILNKTTISALRAPAFFFLTHGLIVTWRQTFPLFSHGPFPNLFLVNPPCFRSRKSIGQGWSEGRRCTNHPSTCL